MKKTVTVLLVLALLPRSFLFFFHSVQRSISLTSESSFSFYTNLGTLPGVGP